MGAVAGGLLGPLLAGILMSNYGAWTPVYAVLGTIPIAYGSFILIPETLIAKVKNSRNTSLRESMANGFNDLTPLLKKGNILLILTVFLFEKPRTMANYLTMPQYISTHFGWSLAETSILLPPLGLLHLAVLTLLPQLSKLVSSRYAMSTCKKDLTLTKASVSILAFGALIQGLSSSIPPSVLWKRIKSASSSHPFALCRYRTYITALCID